MPIKGKYHPTNLETVLIHTDSSGEEAIEQGLQSVPDDVDEMNLTVTEDHNDQYEVRVRYVKP